MSKKLLGDLTAFLPTNRKPENKAMNETAPDPQPADTKPEAETSSTPPQRVYPEPPTYEWDFWAQDALECGIAPELVSLGRAVKREVVQHNWSRRVAELCCDEVMEQMLVKAPRMATRLYDLLLETDGLRCAWEEEDGHMTGEIIELDGSYF